MYKNHVKLVIQSDKYLVRHYWFSASWILIYDVEHMHAVDIIT